MPSLREISIAVITRHQSQSGAYVACPRFENYRYCWLRDGSFTAYAMDMAGRADSARAFYRWVHKAISSQAERVRAVVEMLHRGEIPGPQAMLPTRYALDGTEIRDDWPNFQLDGYGTWLWGLAEHVAISGDMALMREVKDSVGLTVDYLQHSWALPNYDCWEESGDRVHPSTLASIYGGLTAINRYLRRHDIAVTAQGIKDYVLSECVVSGRFAKSIGNPSIDASLLWLSVPFSLVSTDHTAMDATVKEIEQRLHHGGVHRYPEDTYYGGGEWPLLACWLGWYYCQRRERGRAEPILEWVEGCADRDGNLPEQVSTHLNDPDYYPIWFGRWGEIATPLLWSHAMYLVLDHAVHCRQCLVEGVGQDSVLDAVCRNEGVMN